MNDDSSNHQQFEALFNRKDTKALVEYLKSVSVKQLPGLYSQLVNFLSQSFQQHQNIELIRQQAEKFRPVMHYAIQQLIRLYLHQGEMLSKENEAVANACKRFLKIEYKAYMLVLDYARQRVEKKGLLAIAVHRIMVIQLYLHIISYIMYTAIADKEWLNLHRLFVIAKQNGLEAFSVQDEACYITDKVSISDLYSYSLIMGCACLHKLDVPSIIKTVSCIFEWSSLVCIDDKSQGVDNEIVVDISSGAAPNFRKFFTKTEHSLFLYLHLEKMLDAIKKQPTESNAVFNKIGLTEELKVHLLEAWSKYRVREERKRVNEAVEATVGLRHIHYYLCGGRELKDFLGERVDLSIIYEKDEQIALIEQQRSGDIWSPGLSVPSGKVVEDPLTEAFSFQQFFEMHDNADIEKFPVFNIKMVDKSLHGCCLEFTSDAHFMIRKGDLIGFRHVSSHSQWQIGEVAWFKIFENKAMHAGVRLLSTSAVPLGVDVPLRVGAHKNYTEGILFPLEKMLQQRTSIVFQDTFFVEGEHLKVVQKGLVKDLKLMSAIQSGGHYARFNCGIYVSNNPEDDTIDHHHRDKMVDVNVNKSDIAGNDES